MFKTLKRLGAYMGVSLARSVRFAATSNQSRHDDAHTCQAVPP